MRLVTKAELLTLPKGTMFRVIVPAMFRGEWMIFDGPCGDNDFFYSHVGPQANVDPHGDVVVEMDSGIGRDGLFDTSERYVVLDDSDRAAFAAQILGQPYTEIRHFLGDLTLLE